MLLPPVAGLQPRMPSIRSRAAVLNLSLQSLRADPSPASPRPSPPPCPSPPGERPGARSASAAVRPGPARRQPRAATARSHPARCAPAIAIKSSPCPPSATAPPTLSPSRPPVRASPPSRPPRPFSPSCLARQRTMCTAVSADSSLAPRSHLLPHPLLDRGIPPPCLGPRIAFEP